jgi:hypothetical protein
MPPGRYAFVGAGRPRPEHAGRSAIRQAAGESTAILPMAGGAGRRTLPGANRPYEQEQPMPTFLIEREIPGASKLTDDELRGITQKSNSAVEDLQRPYTWCHSYVAGDKIYCVHQAESADVILEHARGGGFPANLVVEVSAVFDSTGPRGLPV